jgi:photosystem II stability/assembly factor-like uncharacterized protein
MRKFMSKKISLITLISIIYTFILIPLIAQQVDINKQFKNLKPRNIGPAAMSGRITTIDAVVSNPNIIWLGAASGGVWKTENSGVSWTPVFDEQPIQNIGSIAIQQNNPQIVWVGTGEGNPRNSINIGEGIFKTMDGGRTFKCMGLEKTRNIHRIAIDPTNPNTVYVGTIGNPYAQYPEKGLFKTTDGGETWNHILKTNDTSGVGDMVMDPTNPNKLFVAMWHHYRTPYSLQSGGKGSGFYMTIDGGKNFVKLGKEHGLPEGDYGRIGVTICKANPNVVYALIEAKKNGLYKSEDGGYKWELVNSDKEVVTNRPFYFQDIIADPKNENRLWMIHQMVTMSEDGGKTFKTVIPYRGIHPDHHAFWIHPDNPDFIIDGNDGGIGITRDRGKNWMFDEKLPVGQFYHINVDNEMPYNVMGGMQDNGSWLGPAYTWIDGGLKNYYWESLSGGDGFDVMPDPEEKNWVYSMSQGGNVLRTNYQTGETWNIKPPDLTEKTRLRFNWNAAIAQDPFDKKTIYFGNQFVNKSTNKGVNWQTISPDLTTNDSAKIDQSKNGGLSIDITGAENFCTIISIEPSPVQKDVIWVGTDDGNVQLTTDGGKNWNNFSNSIPNFPKGAWVHQIRASKYNAGEAFVVVNDYRRGNFKPTIFRTKDFGKTWTQILDEKKIKGYALCIIQDPVEPNLIFVGTEQGLWMSLDNASTFQQFKNGFPSVSTYDLAIQEREADLCIATFGRSLWVLDDLRPLRKLAATNGINSKNFMAFDAPQAVLASYKNTPGYQWSTWGVWDASNRPSGGAISYFIKEFPKKSKKESTENTGDKKEDEQKKETKMDTVLVKIYNNQNELIRNLKWKADTGFNKNIWGLEEKGVRQIASPKPKENAAEPSGLKVLPGTYKVVLQLGNEKDSTSVVVNDDPRFENRNATKIAQKNALTRLQKAAEKVNEGLDKITEAEETIVKIKAQLKDETGKEIDSINKQTKNIEAEIKKIKEFVKGKTQEKQGYGQLPEQNVVSAYRTAQQYITGKSVMPGEQEEILINNADKLMKNAIQEINNFFTSKWSAYRSLVESRPTKLFKDFKEIE